MLGTAPQRVHRNGAYGSHTPEYSSTVIPYNIAPLNFDYQTEGKAYITELKAGTSRW